MPILSSLAIAGLIIWGIIMISNSNTAKKQARSDKIDQIIESMISEYNTKISEVVSGKDSDAACRWPRADAAAQGVALQKNEELLMRFPASMTRSVKTGSEWKSGSAATRVRIAKGISVGVGGTKGRSVATFDHQFDMGWVYLTTKRIIFDGIDANQDFAVPLVNINNVSCDGSTIAFESTMRKNPDFTLHLLNSKLASIFIHLYSDSDFTWGGVVELLGDHVTRTQLSEQPA